MQNSDWYGLLGSCVLHALLFVAFIYIESEPEATEQIGYIQVDFGDFAEGRPVQRAPVTRPEPVPPDLEPDVEDEPEPAEPEESKPVDLPDADPLVSDPTVETPETDVEAIQPPEPQEDELVEDDETEEPRTIQPLGSGSTEGKSGAEEGDLGEGTDEQEAAPFQIEGLNRTPVRTPTPVYASQVNADISVKIWVAPNGRISRQLVLRKGDPRLEDAVNRALKQWQFNPLPANVPQDLQEGTVTFRFRLE